MPDEHLSLCDHYQAKNSKKLHLYLNTQASQKIRSLILLR